MTQNVVTLKAGSSSLKFALYQLNDQAAASA
jgi:acetate kinase